MGLLRALNPLCVNPVAPRHRTARAVEEIARQGRPVTHVRRGGVVVTVAEAQRIDAVVAAKRAAKIAKQDPRPFWERG